VVDQRERLEDQFDVIYYCNQCARRSGRLRVMAAAKHDPTPSAWGIRPPHGWRIWYARRLPKKIRLEDTAGYLTVISAGGAPHGPRKRQGLVVQPNLRFVLVPLAGSSAALDCRRCPARPRETRETLVELAERTVAAGRRDAYV